MLKALMHTVLIFLTGGIWLVVLIARALTR